MAARILVAVLLWSLAAVACGDDDESAPELDDPNQTGRELADEFVTLVRDADLEGLEDFLSDAFTLQRADGSFATSNDYLDNLPEIGEYTISDVSARQDGDVLVVRWGLTIESTIEGQPFSEEPAPRLSVFTWNSDIKGWQLAAHANFNVPEASD
jgi:hypothetical protein